MELNIGSLAYLFFRLAPFFIVSYFALSSIFNQDFRGLVYLVGLVLASVLTVLIGKVLPNPLEGKSAEVRMKCTALTLGKMEPLSNLPLSQTVFGYTLAYLTYFIAVNNLTSQNIQMFIFMSIAILADLMWNVTNTCSEAKHLGLALLIGGAIGVGWAIFIETNAPAAAYYSGVDKAQCSKPSKAMYRCRHRAKA
jgi:hypothetical protein